MSAESAANKGNKSDLQRQENVMGGEVMFKIKETVDKSVLEIEVDGELTKEDYDRLEQSIEKRLTESDKVNMFCRIIELSGMTAQAILSDFKLFAKYYGKIEKMAIVSSKEWTEWVSKLGAVLPMKIIHFDEDEQEKAWRWLLKQ